MKKISLLVGSAEVHEFDYKEVTEVLKTPIGTVMSRLSRARTELKRSLAGVADGDDSGSTKLAA